MTDDETGATRTKNFAATARWQKRRKTLWMTN